MVVVLWCTLTAVHAGVVGYNGLRERTCAVVRSNLDKNTIDIIRVHVYVYCKQLIIYAYFYFYVLYTYSTHKQIVLYFVCPFFKVFYDSSPLRNSKKTSFLLLYLGSYFRTRVL